MKKQIVAVLLICTVACAAETVSYLKATEQGTKEAIEELKSFGVLE